MAFSNRAMRQTVAVGLLVNRADVQVDLRAEIRIADPHQVSQTSELELIVAFGVGSDNHLAPSSHQLINAEVFEMAAIRHVHECGRLISHSKKFFQQIPQTGSKPP